MYFLHFIFAPGLYRYFEYAFQALAVLLARHSKEYLQVNNIKITFIHFIFTIIISVLCLDPGATVEVAVGCK